MRFEEIRVGSVLVAKVLDGRIAADVAPRFKSKLAEYMVDGNRSIVIDLGSVSFIDSSGLGALVSSLKSMGKDGDLVISSAQGTVATMFKLTRMDKVFRMYDNCDAAVAALS
ncbi:MAG: STAS domain-containing protein [Bryobacteraceae bacterium]